MSLPTRLMASVLFCEAWPTRRLVKLLFTFCICSRLLNWASWATMALLSEGAVGSCCESWAIISLRNSSLPSLLEPWASDFTGSAAFLTSKKMPSIAWLLGSHLNEGVHRADRRFVAGADGARRVGGGAARGGL